MQKNEFEQVWQELVNKSHDVLVLKAAEYADDKDRLANFKTAAALKGVTPEDALAGMMVKHTVSIYDMLKEIPKTGYRSETVWDEKIVDHINYLILLKALIIEQNNSLPDAFPQGDSA